MRLRPLALALVALALGLAGCGGAADETAMPETVEGTLPQADTSGGGGDSPAEGDAAAGKAVFAAQGCGGCHTYGAAGSTGTAGPNLDEAGTDYDEAYDQIEKGGGGMPAYGDQLSDKQIADVAAFVTQAGS